MRSVDRTHQVWETEEELIHFIVGAPEVTAYEMDGKPFQFSHNCYTIDEDGHREDWPLVETLDRPLEARDNYVRLS